MSVSVRTRFEVFKRDRFTCTYCGRTPPEVLLEVDHVVPRAAGGSDEIHNLITACATCNRGKAARLLEEGTAPVIGQATVEELQERIAQAQAYMEAIAGLKAVTEHQHQMVVDAWAETFGAELKEKKDGSYWQFASGRFPDDRSIRSVLRRLPLELVLEAIDITAGRFSYPSASACRYFYGVCWHRIREREGTE